MNLDDVLSDDEPEVPAVEAPTAEAVDGKKQAWRDKESEAQGKQRGADGKFVSTGKPLDAPEVEKPAATVETKPEPVKEPDMTPREKALLQAAQDERRKRQDLEQRMLATPAPAKTAEPEKGFWDDPEAALKRMQQDTASTAQKTRIDTAAAIARMRHQDFGEKEAIFMEMAQTMPGLVQQMLAQPDPAEFAYQTATSHQRLKEAGGISELLAKNAAEVKAATRAEVEAEFKAKLEAQAAQRAALPGSLSDARGTTQNKVAWAGPTSLDDILKG